MNQTTQLHDTNVMDHAMAAYVMAAVIAKGKHKKIRDNMECRRKLEIKWEERRLQRAISEFDFM